MRCAALISAVAVSVWREEMPFRSAFSSSRSASCWNVLVDGAAQNKKKTKNEVVPSAFNFSEQGLMAPSMLEGHTPVMFA